MRESKEILLRAKQILPRKSGDGKTGATQNTYLALVMEQVGCYAQNGQNQDASDAGACRCALMWETGELPSLGMREQGSKVQTKDFESGPSWSGRREGAMTHPLEKELQEC